MDKLQVKTKTYSTPKKEGGGTSNITYKITGTDIGGDLNVKSLNANRIMAEYIEANNLQATNGNFVYIVASDGTISTLRGDSLNYNTANIGDLNANNITTNKLKVTDTATIENIFNNYLNSKEIVTDYLTVNKSAHFFEVIIDKIKSVGGTIINTATSCVLDYVKPITENDVVTKYRCYWKRYANENSQDKKDEVTNDWLVNDQAISQNCNLVSGVNHDAGNHYYWRLVEATSEDNPVYVNFDTGQVWEEEGIPTYQIKFNGHEAESEEDVTINAGFTYDNGETNTEEQPDAQLIITDWDIVPVSGIETDWDGDNNVFTVKDTINGLQITPKPVGINDIVQAPYISKGTFSFATEYPTRLNLFVFYDDETVEYHPAPDGATNIYQIELASISNTIATRFVITSAEVNVWHLCNWIDLSETVKDTPTHIDTKFYDAPHVGDNVCQLGYRYTELSSADLIDLGYDSSKTDTASQSLTTPYSDAGDKQAWKDAHVDEVSRASAIIIAAYKTPDAGGTVNGRIIQPIKPPSYAQYQDITDFNLFTHRGTYMDATGAYFKGNLVSESGDIINIGDDLTVETEYYQLISSENPITRPSSGKKDITFRILYVHNGSGTILSSLPTRWYTKTSLDDYNENDDLTVTINSTTQSLEVRLYNENNDLKDTYVATTINLGDITDGKDGAYNQWIYQNAASKPDTPSSTSSIPTGWSVAPQPITVSQPYTWMSTRTVTPRSSSQINYGPWSEPVRITGEDGKNGTDGTTVEFIYKHFNNETISTENPTGNNNWNPSKWTAVNSAHYTGPDDYKWSDNPQGVSSSYLYEYVSTRNSYIQNSYTYWTTFSTPTLWSKYGENGMDGDGVEYIFCSYHSATGIQNPDYNTYNGKSFTNDDFVPQGWTDDPMSPTESNAYVFVSQRKQVGGKWIKPTQTITGTPWSQPAIWARWSKDGSSGDKGDKGDQGDDGINDKLIPIYQVWEVRTTSTSDYNDIVSKLYTNLKFKVFHIEGETVTEQQRLPDAGYKISATVYANSGATLKTYYYNSSSSSVSMTCTSEDNGSLNRFNLSFDNMLSNIYSATTKQDYRKLSQSSTVNTELPVRMIVQLTLNGTVVDQKEYEVTFKAGHVFEVTDAALNSAFFGNWKDSQGNTVNGMSSIRQDMQGIETNVSTLSNDLGTLQSDYSTFKQTAQGFQTKVESDYYDNQGNATINQSSIEQTAQSISAAVQTDIEGKLKRTGIDISNGLINIASDNTTIGGNVYIHGGVLKSNGLISSVDVSAYCTWTGKVNTTTQNYAFTTNKTTIGTFTAGDKITISNLYKNLIQTDLRGQQSDQSPLLDKVTYNIYRDSTLFMSFTSKPSSALTIPNDGGGTYYLEVTSSATLTGSYGYTFNGGLAMTLVKNTVVEMADNGINLAVADRDSNRHYMRFSPDTIESSIFEVGTYATENQSQHFPIGGLRIANGIPQQRIANQTYGNTTSLPKYYRVESAGLWGSLGSQLAVKMCYTNNEHPLPQIDFYIYTTQPTNGVFDLTVTDDNAAMYGLYTGRIIRIKGYNGLVVKCLTKIIRKDQYYGGDTKSQQIKMGGGDNNNFDSKNGTVIERYSLTLILVGKIWYEI